MITRLSLWCISGVFILSVYAGCSSSPSEGSPPGTRNNGPPAFLPADHQALVDKYIAANLSGSGAAVDKVVNFVWIFDQVIGKMDPADITNKHMLMGYRAGWVAFQSANTQFDPSQPKTTLRPGGIRVLSHKKSGDQSQVLLRMISPAAQLPEYRTLTIGTDSEKRVRILDIRLEHSGTSLSEMLRASTLRSQRAMNPGVPAQPDYLGAIRKALETKGIETAVDIIQKIPRKAKRDRNLADLCLVLASQSRNQSALPLETADFIELHPAGKPFVETISLNNFLKSERWSEALPLVEKLGLRFQEDPFWHIVRARLHLKLGTFDEAEKQTQLGLLQEPRLPEVYDMLIITAARKKDFQQAVAWLERARQEFPDIRPELSGKPDFKDLLTSPEYQEWQSNSHPKARPGKAGPDPSQQTSDRNLSRGPAKATVLPATMAHSTESRKRQADKVLPSQTRDRFLESIARDLPVDHPFRKIVTARKKPANRKPSYPASWMPLSDIERSRRFREQYEEDRYYDSQRFRERERAEQERFRSR